MHAALIGLFSSLITILIFTLLKRVDKNTVYGLILKGSGSFTSDIRGQICIQQS
jgi:hypothetical protein